jgi:hypothetical protein
MTDWRSVQTPKKPEIYKDLEDIQAKSDKIFKVVTTTLEVARSVLVFVQSLLGLFEPPILILLGQIIETLEDLKADLLKAGLYWTWDRDVKVLFSEPQKLMGGYPAFEERMVAKLTNELDRTRPDFTSSTDVLALTFHVGVSDVGKVIRLWKILYPLLNLFDSKEDKSLPAPFLTQIAYYKTFAGVQIELPPQEMSRDNFPEGFRVKWDLPLPANRNPIFPSLVIPPPTFLILVSARKNPLPLEFSLTVKSDTSVSSTDKRTQGAVKGNYTDSRFAPLFATDNGTSPRKGVPFYSYRSDDDGSIGNLPFTTVQGGAETKVFKYHPEESASLFFEQDISFSDLEDLVKLNLSKTEGGNFVGETPYKYYFTLCSYTEESVDANYNLINLKVVKEGDVVTQSITGSISKPSRQLVGSVTKQSLLDYQDALLNSLALFIICRLDREEDIYGPFENLEVVSNPLTIKRRQGILELVGTTSKDLDALKKLSPQGYKDKVNELIIAGLDRYNQKGGSFLAETLDIDYTTINEGRIGTTKVSTPLELLESPYAYFNLISRTADLTSFLELISTFSASSCLSSCSPCIITSDKLIRDKFEGGKLQDNYDNLEIYAEEYADTVYTSRDYYKDLMPIVAKVFNAVPTSTEAVGEWNNALFFDTFDIPITKFIDLMVTFFQDLKKSVASIVGTIEQYIAVLNKRIDEIQRLVNEIKRIIDLILSFRFPSGLDMLLTLSQGTNGVVSDLTNSKKKPQSEFVETNPQDALSAGAMLVFSGGTPAIVRELIEKLVGGEE